MSLDSSTSVPAGDALGDHRRQPHDVGLDLFQLGVEPAAHVHQLLSSSVGRSTGPATAGHRTSCGQVAAVAGDQVEQPGGDDRGMVGDAFE